MQNKIKLAILYGGKSAEHEISLISAKNVISAINTDKYDITLIAIDHDGAWFLQQMPDNLEQSKLPLIRDPDNLVALTASNKHANLKADKPKQKPLIDVAFPVLHGSNGEDGTIQGLLRLAGIPFVGADVLSAAVCMDKDVMKRLLSQANIPTARWQTLHYEDLENINIDGIISQLGMPLFIKPANLGSSVGIIKVKRKEELLSAIEHAMTYDEKIIVEEMIQGREIECGILGNNDPRASYPGEIITSKQHDFYSYEAKYLDENGAELITPAQLTESQTKAIQQIAIQAFRILNCAGMARVDCFLTANDKIYINELNTIPGFTKISMYPRMWQASGLSYAELIDQLIQLALEKFDRQQSLKTSYSV